MYIKGESLVSQDYNRVPFKLVFFNTELYLAAIITVIYTDELDVKVK